MFPLPPLDSATTIAGIITNKVLIFLTVYLIGNVMFVNISDTFYLSNIRILVKVVLDETHLCLNFINFKT